MKKNVLNFGNDSVVVKSENLIGLGGIWGCSWDWGERKVEEPEKPLCRCENCVSSVSTAIKKAVS